MEHTKIPYNPQSRHEAKSNDPATWTSYKQAGSAYERSPGSSRPCEGLGYAFADDYTGIDLDHCIDEEGQLDPRASAYLDRLHSYAEYSPSEKGVHCLVRGILPDQVWRRRKIERARHAQAAIEMYSRVRWLTVTGQHVSGAPPTLESCPEAIAAIQYELQGRTKASRRLVRERASSLQNEDAGSLSDHALIEKAMQARNGATFLELWQGDTAGYLSASEADLALCNLLAFWTGNDEARVDRLFRASGLYRPEKWDQAARSGETYGQSTIARACAPGQEVYRHTRHDEKVHGHTAGDVRPHGVSIPFPVREVAPADLHATEEHPLPETEISQVLEYLRRGEAGDAQLFTHLFRGRYLYDHTEREWYAWAGHAWQRDRTNQVINMVSGPLAAVYLDASAQLTEQAAEESRVLPLKGGVLTEEEDEETARARKHLAWLKSITSALVERARVLRNRHRIQNVLALARVQIPLSLISERWDTDPWLLGTPDGVIDLRIGHMHPGRPEEYIRTTIPTSYQGMQAAAPRFERFWHEIFADRPEQERADLIAFLQRALGYGITGQVNEHIFLMLYGEEGRNGKDTLMETLQHVLGPISGAVSHDILITSGKLAAPGSAKSYLCRLQGMRIVWVSETSKGARFDVGQVKHLTGGSAIPARQLYGRDYTFPPSHLLVLQTNHKPHADTSDAAFWNRLCPIIFNLRFVERPQARNERLRDTNLLPALKSEASGILAWLVRGCLEWQRRGLEIPESVLQARQAYRGEEDTLQEFLQECCVLTPQAKARAGKLYERYKAWTSENNLRALNGRAFGLEMKKRFVCGRDEKGNFYQGVSILATDEAG